jgi:hypothetical protein
LRRWKAGKKNAHPPTWNEIYEIAKEFNIAPWIVEQDCTPKWRKQFVERRIAENQENKRLEDKRGKRGNRKRTN